MTFDPFLASKFHLLEGVTYPPTDPIAAARLAEYNQDPAPWPPPVGVAVHEGAAPGPHGPVPCRTYVPERPSGTGLVWVHGGGFRAGDLDMPEAHVVGAELAARANAVVVCVGYRVATNGVRYPVPVDDVCAAWESVTRGHELLRVEGLERVVLGGASAGAALAIATTMRLRDAEDVKPKWLLLAYPFAHFPNPATSPALSVELSGLPQLLRFTATDVENLVRNYVGRLTNLPADALPGSAPLDGLPPVHMVVCEYDDLRASAELLQRQLEEVGVPVSTHLARGMPHGHLNRTPSLREVDVSLDFLARALRGAATPSM